jgi:hypothetical protein
MGENYHVRPLSDFGVCKEVMDAHLKRYEESLQW